MKAYILRSGSICLIFCVIFFALFPTFVFAAEAQGDEENKFEFGVFGEGYTSANYSEGLRVAWRMFSAPDTQKLCASTSIVHQFVAREDHFNVAVGNPFYLSELRIVALNSAGRILKPIPITVETDAAVFDLIYISSYQTKGNGIFILRPGTFQVRVRPFCEGSDSAKLIIQYTVKAE